MANCISHRQRPRGVDFSPDCAILDRMVEKAAGGKRKNHSGGLRFAERASAGLRAPVGGTTARMLGRIWQVIGLHGGPATPSQFLFGDGLHVFAIHLEKMKARRTGPSDIGGSRRVAGISYLCQANGNA